MRGNPILLFLSLSFSFPSPLSKNKQIKSLKKKKHVLTFHLLTFNLLSTRTLKVPAKSTGKKICVKMVMQYFKHLDINSEKI